MARCKAIVHDFADSRVPGDGHRVRECLTERPELDNQPQRRLTRQENQAGTGTRYWGCSLRVAVAITRSDYGSKNLRRLTAASEPCRAPTGHLLQAAQNGPNLDLSGCDPPSQRAGLIWPGGFA